VLLNVQVDDSTFLIFSDIEFTITLMVSRFYVIHYLFTSDFEFIDFGNMKILSLTFPMRYL